MPGGQWTTPTHLRGDVYVTVGTPFAQNWNTGAIHATKVGTFNFDFTSNSTGSFAYEVAAPGGLASADPAFGIPSFSGTKPIQRQPF